MFLTTTRLFLISASYLTENYYRARYVPTPEIAERYNINVRALMPSLVHLTRAGLMRSRVGGKEPGFIFSRDPNTISMLEVLTVLEGDYSFVCCKEMSEGIKCDGGGGDRCRLYTLINGAIAETMTKLANMSLKEYSGM